MQLLYLIANYTHWIGQFGITWYNTFCHVPLNELERSTLEGNIDNVTLSAENCRSPLTETPEANLTALTSNITARLSVMTGIAVVKAKRFLLRETSVTREPVTKTTMEAPTKLY